MSDYTVFDLIKAALAASARHKLIDRISAVVANVLPNRVMYWALVRVASLDAKRRGVVGPEMALTPIGVVAARLRSEIDEP